MTTNEIYRYTLNAFEIGAALTGFANWKKLKNSYWRFFPIFLLLIFINEIIGKIINLYSQPVNAAFYRYYGIPVQFLFYFWLFYNYFKKTKFSKWPLVGVATYIISWLLEMFFLKLKDIWFMSFSYTIGNIILLVMIIVFFVMFINSDEILDYKKSLMFWTALGLIVFYLGTFPLYALRNTLVLHYPKVFYTYYYVSFFLNYCMYLLFITGFICHKPK